MCVNLADQSEEEDETNPSETNTNDPEISNSERKQKWKKKWLIRREKNRFGGVPHHHQHPHHHHSRWSKKGRIILKRFRKNKFAGHCSFSNN